MFSLMLLLLALCEAGVSGTLMQHIGPTAGMLAVQGAIGIVMFGLVCAAMGLAVAGLVEYSRKNDFYTQGRVQAICALAFAGLFTVIALQGFIKGRHLANNLGPVAAASGPGHMVAFEDLNFQFRAPDRPWVSYDGSKLQKSVKLSFMRRFPEEYFFIAAEKVGNVNFTSDQLAETGKASLRAAATSYRLASETPLRVNGLDGLMVESETTLGDYQLHYRQWYCATNGYTYQLVGYCRTEDTASVARELGDMLFRFTLIDPNRIAAMPGAFTSNFHSATHHYKVLLTNSPWRAFPSLETSFPQAEFGASQGDSCLVVAPIGLDGNRPELDVLAPAFLTMVGITYPNENLTNPKKLTDGNLLGKQFDYSREVQGKTFYYRIQVWLGDDEAFLVDAWTERHGPPAEALLNDALGRVRFEGSSFFLPIPVSGGQSDFGERKAQSYILNQVGLFYTKQNDYERSLPLFKSAARANRDDSVYVANALFAWKRLDRPQEALAFLDGQPPSLLAQPVIRASEASFQAQASLVDQSISNFAAVFAGGYRDDSALAEYFELLVERKQFEGALSAVQNYLTNGESVTAQMLEGRAYRLKKDYPTAVSRMKTLHDKAPFNVQVATEYAEGLLAAGQYTEALEVSRDLAKNNTESATASWLKGRCELALKWYREAKISFGDAARLAPANRDIRSYLDYVNGLLGEGDNTATMDPIAPVSFPAVLTNTPTKPASTDYARKSGAYYVRQIVAMSYSPAKERLTTEYMFAKILDASGVSSFSTIQLAFDPLSEQIYVNELRVMDADGNTISYCNPTNYYVLDDRTANAASQKKILNIPVPGLQPGCQLAITTTRRQSGMIDEFSFCTHIFSAAFPVRESIFFLAGDGQGLKYRSSPVMEPQKLPEGLGWRVSDPIVSLWEPLQPSAVKFLPTLWIWDAAAQWPALVTNYLASINDRLELSSELQNESQKLVAGLDGDDAKIGALASYVQTNLTYKAIEFGRRARIPNRPDLIIKNRYGDCKDHAVLLQQMLGSVGVPARLALVSHRGPIQTDMPSLDQFDHMIVYVPGREGSYFLDCTSKGADVAHAIPDLLAGQQALVLDAANPRFVSMPSYATNASSILDDQRLRIVGSTDLSVGESLTLAGVGASWMRNYLMQIPEASRRTSLQTQMGMTEADLTDLKIEGLNDPGKPLRVTFHYLLKQQFRRSNDELRGSVRAGFSRVYFQAAPVENRLTPFEITLPWFIETKTSIEIPSGFHAERLDSLNPNLDPRFGTGQERAKVEPNLLTLDFKFQERTGNFTAPEYEAYRDTMGQALSSIEREVALKANRN